MHETLLLPVLMYGSEKEKERSRIRVVKIDNLRALRDIRRMDKVIECTDKGAVWTDERIDEDVIR